MSIGFPCLVLALVACSRTDRAENPVYICSKEDNDFFQLLLQNGIDCRRFDRIEDALSHCPQHSGLLVLADNYPEKKTALPPDFYKMVRDRKIRSYVEFPDHLPSGKTGAIQSTRKERLITTMDLANNRLPALSILDAGLFRYVEVEDRDAWVDGATVAGFRKAVFGLDSTRHFPVLFSDHDVLIATTKLSDFNKSRYSPKVAVKGLLIQILEYLEIKLEFEKISWKSQVKPMYTQEEVLADNTLPIAVNRGAAWYEKGRFLIHPQWQDQWRSIDTLALPVGPPIDAALPSGDGTLGVMEGHYSYINPDGSQPYRYWLRADCVAETAMTFSMADAVESNQAYRSNSRNLLDFLFNSGVFHTAAAKKPETNSYGLIGWADTHPFVYYGDDNARVLLGSILASHLLNEDQWNRRILELILANFRTSGKNGFRGNSLREPSIEDISWQRMMEKDLINPAPHYESWLWALYIWLYHKTGYLPLLEKAKRAISITMEKYPGGWIWTNGIQQERARLILPLSWLLRVEDTPVHRNWLNLICHDLLQNQVECGALREELGVGNRGKYGAPASNRDYGNNEAPVIHQNGEPVADMLYTSNFAFFALNEAAAATGDSSIQASVRKLGDFLLRIQSKSDGRQDLDGCWFRAFDYEAWEYYGSNADHGWGAWGTLTGWTQSFITTTLALQYKNTSYWDLTINSTVGSHIADVWPKMLE